MSEYEQLKTRIDEAGMEGVLAEHIRDDYEPAGQMMMQRLCDSDHYVQRKGMGVGPDQKWRIFKTPFQPY
ncbi:MAG: hypothetical protein COA78_07085 [Blastopirellula sp.]|nr:MAG: hypothetical protein COA78_07085 [Blastopirellula sp.]